MAINHFSQRMQCWPCARSIATTLWLLVGFFCLQGCTRKDGATINVIEANVSNTGAITVVIQIKSNGDALRVSDFLGDGATEKVISDHTLGSIPSTFINKFDTADPSSVRFFVTQGDAVFIPIGEEVDILQFTPRRDPKNVTTHYTIRVRGLPQK